MTRSEYDNAMQARQKAISRNASNRLRGLPTIAVPSKPEQPMVPIAYTLGGDYEGRLANADDCPVGCVVRMEVANY